MHSSSEECIPLLLKKNKTRTTYLELDTYLKNEFKIATMTTRTNFLMLMLCLFGFALQAQNGTLRGKITDTGNGEALMFANVLVKELGTGGTTDLDGAYSLSMAEGVYTLEFSYVGYATLTVTDVKIESGKVNELDVQLSEGETLTEVVVKAEVITNSEVGTLILKKKSLGMIDAISTQSIKRSGDSNVGKAIKRVAGVSVEGGKHVIVRGLGDRYSKTILNGMDVPGLDPDRNSVQLDIFPTNLVDNIIVHKTFLPELPGDFSGGMVNIITKDFPSSKTFSVSAGGSFNPDMHFNDQFITYKGGNTDFLGFDDGNRELPISQNTNIPRITDNDPELTKITQSFNPTMATFREQNGMNFNGSISYGNQKNFEKFDIGYTLSANYRNETTYYDDFQFNASRKDPEKDVTNLLRDVIGVGELGNSNVLWSTQVGTAIKSKNHKIAFSALRSQSAESRAAFITQERIEFGQSIVEKHNLEYTERSVTNFLLSGKHNIADGKFIVNWKLSPTFSEMSEPDIRLTAYETTNGFFELNPSTGGGVSRTWRAMDESNYGGKTDIQYGFVGINEMDSKLKFGIAANIKERDFSILDYIFPIRKRGTIPFTGDPNELFTDELIWSPENDKGVYTQFNFEPAKTYNARQNILAAYAMNELPVTEKLKFIYGLRVEKADNWYTGRNQNGTENYNDEKVLDELNFLPSVNAVYNLKEDKDAGETMNLRGSFSRTVARPSFKEKSIAQITDRITGRTFIGNIDLEQTQIYNGDLRWEYYLPKGETVSFSAFYKSFDKPIELTPFKPETPNDFSPTNVGDATVFGLEFEFRKNFSFISPALEAFSFTMNATAVRSSVEMTAEEKAGRETTAREGETIGDTRDMVGQSPFLINGALNYVDRERGWEGNISFNTQGERLSIAGSGQIPDVYERPFNSLNLKVSKRFGKENRWNASVGAGNILGAKRKRVYRSFGTDDELFDLYVPGRSFSVGIGYKL